MEVIAIAEPEARWRWEIRHAGTVVKRSDGRFATAHDAIEDGKPLFHVEGRAVHVGPALLLAAPGAGLAPPAELLLLAVPVVQRMR